MVATFNNACCQACGARQVNEPLAPPDVLLPRIGQALTALGMALLPVVVFLLSWLFGNDMKVGRVLLVWLFGDSLKATRNLLSVDPKLPYYNIFSYDAYRQAFYLSLVVIPLALLGIWLARRARRLIQTEPIRFSGRRMADAALMLSVTMMVVFSGVVISSVPRVIENYHARRAAATRATMYHVADLLHRYNEFYGRYPEDLIELQDFSNEPVSQLDYWQRKVVYAPAALVASRELAQGFSDYKLISAGADGVPGTADDIVLQDGVIVSSQADNDNLMLPGLFEASENSR